jgi:hypothetical protein
MMMSIQIGEHLPAGSLAEFVEVAGEGCNIGPNTFRLLIWSKEKRLRFLVCQVHTRQLVRHNIFLATSRTLLN